MNTHTHYLLASYNWNNRRPRNVSAEEFDLSVWDVTPQRREPRMKQIFHPGMISATLALIVLVASL